MVRNVKTSVKKMENRTIGVGKYLDPGIIVLLWPLVRSTGKSVMKDIFSVCQDFCIFGNRLGLSNFGSFWPFFLILITGKLGLTFLSFPVVKVIFSQVNFSKNISLSSLKRIASIIFYHISLNMSFSRPQSWCKM